MRIAWHGDAFRDVVDWVSDTWGAAVCNFLRSMEFRFGNAVQAVQGSLVDVDVFADHVGGDAGVAQSQCQCEGNGSLRRACSRSLSSSAT